MDHFLPLVQSFFIGIAHQMGLRTNYVAIVEPMAAMVKTMAAVVEVTAAVVETRQDC